MSQGRAGPGTGCLGAQHWLLREDSPSKAGRSVLASQVASITVDHNWWVHMLFVFIIKLYFSASLIVFHPDDGINYSLESPCLNILTDITRDSGYQVV